MKYRRLRNILEMTVVFSLIFVIIGQAFPYGYSSEGRALDNMQTFLISDFGDEHDQTTNLIWKPEFSRYAKPADLSQVNSEPDPEACNVDYFESKPLGLQKKPVNIDETQKYCLGVKAQFIKKGYNWIELVPFRTVDGIMGENKPDRDKEGEQIKLPLPGVVESLDIWVWGGNYHYWIEFYIYDYKGYLHRLNAGDINFIGWKNISTKIPKSIPQWERVAPFHQPLKLDRIKLWSYPQERADQFFVYLDYMQVQTDTYYETYNGDDIGFQEW